MSETDINRSVKAWKKSAHHGAGEWLAERGTSLVLIPLTLWAMWAACQIVGGGYDAAIAFAKVPLNAGIIAFAMLIACWHMYMGLKVIIDDYIGKPSTRGILLFLTFVLSAGAFVATAGALWIVHQAA